MVAQYSQSIEKTRKPNTAAIATLFGLAFGTLLVFLGKFSGLVAAAMWPLGVAIGLMAASWLSYRYQGEAQWGMAIAGQLLGAVATGMLFIAAMI